MNTPNRPGRPSRAPTSNASRKAKSPRTRTKSEPPAPLPAFVEADLAQDRRALDPVFMLDEVIVETLRLVEANGRHPVLVGPHDCGKSSVVRAIAAAIVGGARPAGARAIWRVSMRSIDLATHKDGTFVQALSQVVADAATSPSKPLLWIPDAHLARVYDVHSVLALLLERSGVRMIGEALPPFDRQCLDDVELANALHPLRMPEVTESQTRVMLTEHRAWLAAAGRSVRRSALERALLLSRGAFANRALPGRAFRALSLALEASDPSEPLTGKLVSRALRRTVDVPPALGDRAPAALREALEKHVAGQRAAIDVLAARYAVWRAGATQRHRPASFVILAGPPGVGKTHLASEFARSTLGHGEHLIAVYGGEFAEDWKVDQLLGQVGASSPDLRRGMLASALAGAPVSVVLVDEIERAHPLLLRWLMQAADAGSFITGSGELVNLENTFVIVTTNVGADAFRDTPLGVRPMPDDAQRLQALRRAIAQGLPPELIDRADALVCCEPLSLDARRALASRWAKDALRKRHGRTGRTLVIESLDEAIDAIASRRLDARSLRAALDLEVLAPAFEHAHDVAVVRATVRDARIVFTSVGQEGP
ncbi:MAG: ATP-dependent Clp protease ATP-binding subunit [Myxococcales bacterium]|nr:ATP-dependent Clp protease ATP-binding subunit [Myxococcales bacterium]